MRTLADTARKLAVRLGARELVLGAGKLAFPPGTPRVVQVTMNGVKLLVLANEDVGRRIALLRRYEPRDSRLLARLVRADDVCIDVGANTGFYTMLMGARATRGAVHAFEPMRLNWHLLETGVLLNGWTHVVANHSAVGDRDGTIAFSEAVDGAYSSLVAVGRRAEARRIEVAVTRLDTYAAARKLARVDVIKVDVEGAERLVIMGAGGLLAGGGAPPRVVMLELVDANLRTYGASVGGIVERMSELGYRPFYASEAGPAQAFRPEHAGVYENVFFARRSEDLAGAAP